MPLIRYPGRFSFKKLSDFKPFLDDPVRLDEDSEFNSVIS